MLQEIINAADIGLVVVGPDMEIRLWNQWMEDATGIMAETACNQHADRLLPHTFTPELTTRIKQALGKTTTIARPFTVEAQPLLAKPVDISVQVLAGRRYVQSLLPVREEMTDSLALLQIGGHAAGARAGASVRAAAGHSRQGERDEAHDRSEAMRLDFLATVGHQIRTPVNGVLGVAELLRETPLTAEQRKYVDLLVRSGRSLQSFVGELTDLSYLEAGQATLEREVTEIHTLLADMMGLFESTASQKGVKGIVDIASGVPAYAWTDHQKLRQLLAHVVENAFKFTHQGSVRLRADYSDADMGVDKKKAGLTITVQDTGVGIPRQRVEKLFTPYSARVGDESRTYHRTGVGLQLCRELVELFEGEVSITSTVGKGTTVTLRLPMERVDNGAATAPGSHETAELVEQGRLRVLLAEDNPVNQELFRSVLENKGHEVVVVSNGQEAVTAVQIQARFDIILMDISMPVMDGMEATSLIRSLHGTSGQTPILALTAHALAGDREMFLNAGMDGYQSKPVEPDQLLEAMARVIASRRSRKGWFKGVREPERSARPGNGPMSWLRFPKSGQQRETDPADP